MKTQLIYVTGQGHTGSTLLTLLLGAHSRIAAMGEACALSEWRRRSKLERFTARHAHLPPDQTPPFKTHLEQGCMCGAETMWSCPVWSAVEEILKDRNGRALEELDVDSDDDDCVRPRQRRARRGLRRSDRPGDRRRLFEVGGPLDPVDAPARDPTSDRSASSDRPTAIRTPASSEDRRGIGPRFRISATNADSI